MFIISQICSLDIRLQVHFNHILTLLYTGDLELCLLWCRYHRKSTEVCEAAALLLAALQGVNLLWWFEGDGANYAFLFPLPQSNYWSPFCLTP